MNRRIHNFNFSGSNFPGRILHWICCLTLLLFAGSGMAVAEQSSFTASVSQSTVAVGDQVQISFTLNGTGKNFRPPSFSDFNILMGPSQSSSTQIFNGSISQSQTFTYILQAVKEGVFKIGSAEITVGGDKVLSNTVTITVEKGSRQSSSGSAQGGQGSSGSATSGGNNVFLRAQVDRTNVYQGEGIVVTYKLYTRVTLLNYSIDKLPAMNGFWSQEISLPQQLEFHSENLDGVGYKVAEVKKLVAFPQRSGNLEIDPMQGEVIARVQVKRQPRSNDPFDPFSNDPFFNNPFFNNNVQDVKVPLKSQPIRVTVKELPEGAPVSFTGAVGKFGYEVSLDKDHTKTNEPVSLKIKISGKGNVKLIDAPQITFPPDFETYDPKETSNINATAGGVTGSKTFEYLIIPRNPGEFHIPVSAFSFFDIEKKKYTELSAPDLQLSVEKGSDAGQAVAIQGGRQSDIQLLGKDIRFIKTSELEEHDHSTPLFGTTLFYSLLGAPVLLFAGLLLVRRRREHMMGNMALVRSQRANKMAMKRLSSAKKYLAGQEKEKFLDEMFKALWGFVSDKLRIPVSALSRETVSKALLDARVPGELVNEFTGVLDSCEFARFSGGSGDSNESIYQKGIAIISKIESAIRS